MVRYHPSSQEVLVTHPNPKVRSMVRDYLTKEQTFDMTPPNTPNGVVGSRIQVIRKPVQDKETMIMALCQLHANTMVHTDWSNSDNYGISPDGGNISLLDGGDTPNGPYIDN